MKYQRFTPSGCNEVEIGKFDFLARTQLLYKKKRQISFPTKVYFSLSLFFNGIFNVKTFYLFSKFFKSQGMFNFVQFLDNKYNLQFIRYNDIICSYIYLKFIKKAKDILSIDHLFQEEAGKKQNKPLLVHPRSLPLTGLIDFLLRDFLATIEFIFT